MKAEGLWTFWNQYSTVSLSTCVERAKQLEKGVVVKGGYWTAFNAFKAVGVPVAVERYVYPTRPVWEAQQLSEGINRGAEFAVINAEVEWGAAGADGGIAMLALIREFQRLQPDVEFYASVDTRGGRTHMPYQQVLGAHCTGWMPMIYPLEFYPNKPVGRDWVGQSFIDCLEDGQNFQNKPVLPTIQTYHNIGAGNVRRQLEDVADRDLEGCQAYTVGHATHAEWNTFVEGVEMTPTNEELEQEIQKLNLRLSMTGKVLQWAGYGMAGDDLPEDLADILHFVLHLAEQARDDG